MRRERFKNLAESVLSGSITDSATEILLADGARFPSVGNFTCVIDSEIVICTARSGNTLTVLRGQESTEANSHPSGAKVVLVMTAGSVSRWSRDNSPYWDSSRPPFGLQDSAGDLIDSTDFSVVNADGRAVSDQAGTLLIRCPAHNNTNSLTHLCRAAPTPPYAITVAVQGLLAAGTALYFGAAFRDSSTQEQTALLFLRDSAFDSLGAYVQRWTENTFNSNQFSSTKLIERDIHWIKLVDDGSDLTFSISHNGIDWIDVHTESRDAHLSDLDQVCITLQAYNTTHDSLVSVVHYSETAI